MEYLTEEETEQLSEQSRIRLKRASKNWIKYDIALKESQARSKKLLAKRKEKEKILLELTEDFTEPYDIDDPIEDGKAVRFRRAKSVRKGPVDEKCIKSVLTEMIGDTRKVDEIYRKIQEMRTIKEVDYMKKTSVSD